MSKPSQVQETLANLLEERRMTEADLARALDVSGSTVNRWLHGSNNLSAVNLARIAAFFGVDLGTLMPPVKKRTRRAA